MEKLTKKDKEVLAIIASGTKWKTMFQWHSDHKQDIHIVQLKDRKKYAYYDSANNKFISNYLFDNANEFGLCDHKNMAIVQSDGKYNVLFKNGKFMFKDWKERLEYPVGWPGNHIVLFENGNIYMVDERGDIVRELCK